MASRYPRAVWSPLGPQTQGRMTAHDILCLHTMVGSLSSTNNYFRQGGFSGTESHYGVGDATDPRVLQWQDRAYRADANLDGNDRVISVETADTRGEFKAWSGSNVPAWTAWQLRVLAELVAWECSVAAHAACPASWACHRSGIPLVLIPDTKPGRRGVGYHRQGVDPWRVSGGEKWSSSRGKVCPGDRRVAQVPAVIAAAKRIVAGAEIEELDVDEKTLEKIVGRVVDARLTAFLDRKISAPGFLRAGDPKAERSIGWHLGEAVNQGEAGKRAGREAAEAATRAAVAAEQAVALLQEPDAPGEPQEPSQPAPPATLRALAAAGGFTGDQVAMAAAVAMAESGGYVDAVGDWTQLADPTVAAKWGPSVGLWQIRTLVDPTAWATADRVRDIEQLRDPLAQARAAHAISKGGTDWSPWSVYRSGSHSQFIGSDYPLRTGHAEAARWRLSGQKA
jgi:hypothetical protein